MRNPNLFIIIVFVCSFSVNAQNVEIPDANFKAALITAGVDKNQDGQIQLDEASQLDTLNVRKKQIIDLTGIEAFVRLEKLNCSENKITKLDLSKNRLLRKLDIAFNKLTNIDLSRNTALTLVACHLNNLTRIDVSNNVALLELFCAGCGLETLDISNNKELMRLNCNSNKLSRLDISKNK
ncbi:MAG: hypothetical protein WCL14_14925, partial [Bacteroidota bacterium]